MRGSRKGKYGKIGGLGDLRVFFVFLLLYGFFRDLEWSHDVPDLSAIIFGPGITQNRWMASIFDQFSTFLDKSGPPSPNCVWLSVLHTFLWVRSTRTPAPGVPKGYPSHPPTLFEKIPPISPPRPNPSVENDPIPILSISGFHQKWPIYRYTHGFASFS